MANSFRSVDTALRLMSKIAWALPLGVVWWSSRDSSAAIRSGQMLALYAGLGLGSGFLWQALRPADPVERLGRFAVLWMVLVAVAAVSHFQFDELSRSASQLVCSASVFAGVVLAESGTRAYRKWRGGTTESSGR